MRSDEYEHIVAQFFEQQGYKTEVTQTTGDYGVDIFAAKDGSRIAIQAKMYGSSTRPINRQMIMELHGAKDYFDCSRAVMATNGRVLDTAMEVARKLKIEILIINAQGLVDEKPLVNKEKNGTGFSGDNRDNDHIGIFAQIWENHVTPLQGRTLYSSKGSTNKVTKVDWGGIERVTSNGKKQRIKIEIFKKTINHLLKHGSITRKEINEEYAGRASSGIVLILGHTEVFEITARPSGLIKVKE